MKRRLALGIVSIALLTSGLYWLAGGCRAKSEEMFRTVSPDSALVAVLKYYSAGGATVGYFWEVDVAAAGKAGRGRTVFEAYEPDCLELEWVTPRLLVIHYNKGTQIGRLEKKVSLQLRGQSIAVELQGAPHQLSRGVDASVPMGVRGNCHSPVPVEN